MSVLRMLELGWRFVMLAVGRCAYIGVAVGAMAWATMVTAAATGRELWSFGTDGPVRFAPAIWRADGGDSTPAAPSSRGAATVFVVSDDGYLYALSASEGRLLWKRRGGPQDDLLLGNDRLV